jgi:DNA-binding NarL/FixJ family response regulator
MTRVVLIADDHPLFREALKFAVSQALLGAQIVEADSVDSLFAALEAHGQLELLLLDLSMPGAQGFSALVQARAHYPTVPVIVISAREDRDIIERTLAHGAAGFVPKSSPIAAISDALRVVLQGGVWMPAKTSGGIVGGIVKERASGDRAILDSAEADAASRLGLLTPQQFRVLAMVSAGLINKQIGAELGVSEATVKAHMTAIMQKLGVTNRTQAVLLAQRLALDHTESLAAG